MRLHTLLLAGVATFAAVPALAVTPELVTTLKEAGNLAMPDDNGNDGAEAGDDNGGGDDSGGDDHGGDHD